MPLNVNTVLIYIIIVTLCKTTLSLKYVNQVEAMEIRRKLFDEFRYNVGQILELSGLSCAYALMEHYSDASKILVYCGPGMNGGSGLVCARHLKTFGRQVEVYYANDKEVDNDLYDLLAYQCRTFGIYVNYRLPSVKDLNTKYNLIVDALFGSNYRPPPKQHFLPIMEHLKSTSTKIFSLDVPSGWNINTGPSKGDIQPDGLISFAAPKLCAKKFRGKHFLGGRFVPPSLDHEMALQLAVYHSTQLYADLINMT